MCSKKVLIQSQWNGKEIAVSFHTSQFKLLFLLLFSAVALRTVSESDLSKASAAKGCPFYL